MKYADMQTGVAYIVTRKSADGEFRKGDHIRLMADGSIICKEAEGWIDAEDVAQATRGMECDVDRAAIDRRRAQLEAELAKLQ